MKKKILVLVSTLLTAAFAATGLAACAPPHRYADNYSYDSTSHWREITCIHQRYADEVTKEPHIFDGNFCSVCGYYKTTDGLSYTAIRNGESIIGYSVSGMGSAKGYYAGIPAKHEGKPVLRIDYNIFNVAEEIVIPETVTEINTKDNIRGDNNLKKITVVPKNPYFASFDGILYERKTAKMLYVPNVEGSVVIPDGVPEIPSSAFFNCRKLTEITIPESVTKVGSYAFDSCTNLQFNTYENGRYLGGNGNPYRIFIAPDDNAPANFTLHKDAKIIAGGAFKLHELTDINLPDGLESICENAFNGRQKLTTVALPDTLKVLDDYAFANCINLTKITIPSSLEKLGNHSLNGCNSLEFNEYDNAYYLGNESQPYTVLIKAKTRDITGCTVNENTRFVYEQAFYECGKLASIDLPDTIVYMGEQVFWSCGALESITLPKYLTQTPQSMFNGCMSLRKVRLPDYLQTLGKYTFSNCVSLEEITLPDTLQNIEYAAFNYCSSLKKAEVPSSVEFIGISVFAGCSNLNSLTLPFVGQSKDEIERIYLGHVFGNTENNGVPDSLTHVKVLGGEIKDRAFKNCRKISKVQLVGVKSIGEFAFNGCERLTTIELGNIKKIAKGAFANCSTLPEITIPEGVTTLISNTFNYCYALKEIHLPSSLIIIDSYTFEGCSQLNDIYYNGTVEDWGKVNRIENSGINYNYTVIHCTDDTTTYTYW